MWVEIAILAYAGLACLARAGHRHRGLPLPGGRTARAPAARATGWILLIVGQGTSWACLGPAQGMVAFLSTVMVTGTLLVLLLSVRPRVALAVTVPLFAAWFIVPTLKWSMLSNRDK